MAKTSAIEYQVRWRVATAPATQWSSPVAVGADGAVNVPGLQQVSDYVFQARARSACGAWSAWAVQQFNHPTPDMPAPSLPDAFGGPDTVHIKFGDGQLRGDLWYEIQRAPDNDGAPGAWTTVGLIKTTVWDDVVTDTSLYWYRFRTVDYDGNASDWVTLSSPVAATVSTGEVKNKFDQDIADIQNAATELGDHVTSLQTQVDGIVVGDLANAKQWSSTEAYAAGAMVYDSGKLYRAKQAVPAGTALTDTSYWEIVGDYAALKASLDGKAEATAVTALTTRVTNNESVITSTSQSLALLGAKNGASTAFVLNQNTVQIGGGTTFASMLSGLQTSDGNLSARIDTEQTARISGDTVNASSITSLQARMPGGTGTLATKASVDSEVTARADGDSANASSITSLAATVNDPTTGLAATASVATQAKATADNASGKVNASYTLRVDGGGRVSGFIAQSNGVASDFTVVADKFSIVSPTGGARTEYSAGQWRVYDSAGVLRVKMGVL